jgi:hypothetical protein
MIPVLGGALVALGSMLLLDLVNLDVFDPVAVMVSYYVHARAGGLVTLVGLGCAVAAFALVPRLRRPGAVAVFGAGMLVAGLVPTQPFGQWDHQSVATVVHGIGGWAAFVAIPVAAWRSRREVPGWPGAVAAAMVVLLAIGTVDAMDGPDLLGHVLGLVERVLVVAELTWLVLAAWVVRQP